MLRAKSPFKKRSPKIGESDQMPAPISRPSLHQYSSVQEFQELQKQQQLLNGNAWAQQKGRSRTNSQVAVDEPDTPQTSIADVIESFEATGRKSFAVDTAMAKKSRKHVPAPLKLIPDTAARAVPTQRDSLENKKHSFMQAQVDSAAHGSNDDYNIKLRDSITVTPSVNPSVDHVPRPKSPGKKLFQKWFGHHTSSETPPKISPEWEATPEKAVKILGKESLTRRKESKAAKKRASDEEKLLGKLEFKCTGDGLRSRSDTLASTVASTPSTAEFDAPTDREIRSIGGFSRYATRVPTTAAQRTVSDTATIQSITAAIDGKYDRASDGYHLEHQHNHLQYINNAIPPTPPSKDSRRGMTMRPPITEVPPLDVKAVLSDQPDTPNTAFRVVSKGEKPSPLPPHLTRHGRNEYLNLVLNKPSYSSPRGAPSVRSAYGFIISPSAELANGSSFASPVSRFIESPIIPRSAGLPKSRDASFESVAKNGSKDSSRRSRTLSRRWSDSSLAAWKAQTELAVPCLPTTFYSPYGYSAPSGYRDFTRPSANDDPSLYYLPQTTATGDLESFASRTSSEGKPTPPTSAESSFASDKGVNKEDTPVTKPRKFLVKKRSTSNIAAAARKHAAHGLGLTPLIDEAMYQLSKSANTSEGASFQGVFPNAVPPPLNIVRPASMESLPAKEELDAFLSLHMHIDDSLGGISRFMEYKFDQSVQAATAKHDETLKALHTSFEGVFDKINGVEEHTGSIEGSIDTFKNEMNGKMMDLVKMLQENVLNPMGKMIETNAQLDKSVAQLITRVVELEKSQKEIYEAVTSKAGPKSEHSPAVTLPSIMPNPSPAPSTNPSPHNSYSGQNYVLTYPTSYATSHPTAAPSHVQGYLPGGDPFTSHGHSYAPTQGWNGQQFVDGGFFRLPREQRAQRLQAPYGDGGLQPPTHPIYRNSGRNSGSGAEFGKDGANGA